MSSPSFTPYLLSTRPVAFVLHPLAVIGLTYCVFDIVRKRRGGKWSMFWYLSVFTCLTLIITSLFEIAFAAISLTGFPIPYTPLHSFCGDLFVRLGMVTMTGARLYRLTLSVDPAFTRRALGIQAVATIALFVSLCVTIWMRANEMQRVNPATGVIAVDTDLQNIRNTESLVTFIVFILVQSISLAGDVAFNLVVINSAAKLGVQMTKRQKIMDSLVYVPAALINIIYLVIVIWARIVANTDYQTWRTNQYLALTLSRFAPSLEMITFLLYTIGQTKKLLKMNAPSKASDSLSSSGRTSGSRTFSQGPKSTMSSPNALGTTSAMGTNAGQSEAALRPKY
ncbi:hypothetical protein BC828DRAFT_387987 [Blastocladiella britannica]|nr:hypothetical protein BC828DRAFT_387987 [Blastocladiella britannica]